MSRPRVREDLAALDGYHSAQVSVEVRLNTNEAPEPPPGEFIAALAGALGAIEWHRYPERSASELRSAIAKLHDTGPEQVFAANGSNEVLQTVLLTFAGAGRSVATFEPTYALHGHLARISGARTVEGERARDFSLDLDEVERVLAVEQPAVTFLCSPNNPTGMVDEPDAVRVVLDRVTAIGGLLVVDEAYGQFARWSATELLGEDVPLVVTRTYSKTWAMAGFRLGYLLGPTWLVAELDKVVLPYHLDSFKQLAGRLALDHVDDMERRVATIVDERTRIEEGLSALGATVWPSGANFVLFRPRDRAGADVWKGLLDRSVLVRDCSGWPRLDGCLRVTIGTPAEDDAFLAALEEVLR
jgi:histidinol-phosphate aminotransferase